MSVLDGLEQKLKAFVEDAVHEAEANAPAIEDAIGEALRGAGVPEQAVTLAAGLVTFLRDHFQGERAPEQPEAPADPQPEPDAAGA